MSGMTEMRFVGMHDTWAVMWSETAKAYYVLPMEAGYERIITGDMSAIGKLIAEQKATKKANRMIGGNVE